MMLSPHSTGATPVAPSRPSRRPRRGFTLVELLVVIGIIALLMSILLPTLGRVREQANKIKCGSNLRNLGMAFIMYAKDNKDYFPAGSRWPTNLMFKNDWIWYQEKSYPAAAPSDGRPTPDLSQSAIVPYLSGTTFQKELYICPSDDVEQHGMNGSTTEPYKYSYAMNAYFEAQPGSATKVKTTQIRNPSAKILLAEEDYQSINDGLWSPGNGNVVGAQARDLLSIIHDRMKVQPDPRDQDLSTHPNGQRAGNVVCVDGHVEFMARVEAHKAEHLLKEK
ncbi:MAG TPA: type II secretion system protein [Humisphaera sp.]